jgi:hypothetical protein
MVVNSHLVVNSSPPNQSSVFGPVAESRLLVASRLQTHNAVIRSHREKLFRFTVGNDVEASSGKSALELCWETLQRVQDLNRRIALYQNPEGRIERSGKFYYFLIRVAGIASGDVAAAKFMDDPRNDCRMRDYAAEKRCPNYLIETFNDGDVEVEGNKTFLRNGKYQVASKTYKTDKPWSGLSFSNCIECGKEFVDGKSEPELRGVAFCGETDRSQGTCKASWLAKHPAQCELPRPEPRFQQVTPEDVAWGERQGLNHSNPSARTLAAYETKLLADVAAYRAKDHKLRDKALQLDRSGKLYRQFCVAFEFKKKTSAKLREAVAEELANTIPHDALTSLIGSAENRQLLTAPLPEAFEKFCPIESEHTPKSKRHYVRHVVTFR